MSWWVWVVIAIVVVAAAAAVVVGVLQQQRSRRLRGTFGPEYDRTVEARGGNRMAAERELAGRMNRRRQLQIVPLSEQSRQQYLMEWQQVQAQFVDAPTESVAGADALVRRVMHERGYPMGDFEQQAGDISVDHPDVVEHYRAAHRVSTATPRGSTSTEEQRTAMLHYRGLFEELLRPSGDDERTAPPSQPQYAAASSNRSTPPPAPPPPPQR